MKPNATNSPLAQAWDRSSPPIAVGGVGGSGTRVVAEILMIFGYYMGNDLNRASDNLLYTFLFKRPKWYLREHDNDKTITTGINSFHKLMLGGASLSAEEVLFLLRAIISKPAFPNDTLHRGRIHWIAERLKKLRRDHLMASGNEYIGWGWKEPNTHLILRNLANHFDGIKYIHTIRHGLDMAFSDNQHQLNNWGALKGIERPRVPADIPRSSLAYWATANSEAVAQGKRMGEQQFLLLNYDRLCQKPKPEIDKLINFLGIDVDEESYQQALDLPSIPASMGRYKQHELRKFNKGDLATLRRLGFNYDM